MIIEMRTYTLKPGSIAEAEKRFGAALPAREKHSKLAAFWHTEIGPLNPYCHNEPGYITRWTALMSYTIPRVDVVKVDIEGHAACLAAPCASVHTPAIYAVTRKT